MNKEKKCSQCLNNLPMTDKYFASRYDRGKKEFQSKCKECQKEYRKRHYEKNKKKYLEKTKKYRENFIKEFIEYKKTLKCEICGESRFWVLDFHHKDSTKKDKDISYLVRSCNRSKLMQEIKKCIVVCSNCHRDIHYRKIM